MYETNRCSSRRDFIASATLASALFAVSPFADASELLSANVHSRGRLANSLIKFKSSCRGHVAFLGGSITEMKGYRPLMCQWLTKRFPETDFTFTDAGLSSTCSTTGAFRLERDILSKGPVDLFFLEFAVNDDQDARHSIQSSIRGMEGIVRHIRNACPNVDIVMTLFVNEPIMAAFRAGNVADSIIAHRTVAEHYKIPTIDVARQVTSLINRGKITWKEYGGVHPSLRGNTIAADMIAILLDTAWSETARAKNKIEPHIMPKPIDVHSYFDGRFEKFEHVRELNGWTIDVPNWSKYPGQFRKSFDGEQTLHAEKPGAQCMFDFHGTAIGAFVLAGPDAGSVEFRIDGGAPQKKDLFHTYSKDLHYPRTVMFNDELTPGRHTIALKISGEKNAASRGHAVRILNFAVNGQ